MKIGKFDTDYLLARISPATLGLLRVLTGLILLVQLVALKNYIVYTLSFSKFFMSYDFFHWVKILPVEQMESMWTVLEISAIFVMLGVFYRPAIIVLTLGWSYILMLCNGHFNNHYYLLALILFLLSVTDGHKWLSVKNVLARSILKQNYENGVLRKLKEKAAQWLDSIGSIGRWQILIFQLQLVIVYFFGAIAKLNKDWFNAFPMKMWLPGKYLPFASELLNLEATAYFFSYSGFVLDLCIGFMLMWKRTRIAAVLILTFFHLPNHFIWNIGVFPWFMLGANLLFFPPDWPEKVLAWLTQAPGRFSKLTPSAPASVSNIMLPSWKKKLVLGFFFTFMTWQVLFPLRHLLFPGNTAWTGVGDNFAWRMMLLDRTSAVKILIDVPGKGTIGAVDLEQYLTGKQFLHFSSSPRNYIRFAKYIRGVMKESGMEEEPEIKAHVYRSLNGRPYQLLLDSTVNLAAMELTPLKVQSCLMPFQDLPYKDEFEAITEEEKRVLGL